MTPQEIQERCGGRGRWPANLILSYPEDEIGPDGKPLPNPAKDEVVGLFPQSSVTGLRKDRAKNPGTYGIYGGTDKKFFGTEYPGDSGSAARFFYCAKASRRERNMGLENPGPRKRMNDTAGGKFASGESNHTCNTHPTVKPLALMRYLLTLVTQPEVNLILDPFCGSGSTLVACRQLGLEAVGIEQDAESVETARKRIACAELGDHFPGARKKVAERNGQSGGRRELSLFAEA